MMTDRSMVTELTMQGIVADTSNDARPVMRNGLALQGLMNRLHSVLDFDQLIVSFVDEVKRALPCDGIEYSHDRIRLYYTDGLAAQHSCKYGLRHVDEFLGEVRFTREFAFEEHELEAIETMVAGLIPPLNNALKYHQSVSFAHRDELTELRNGSYYHDCVEMEIRRAHRYQVPFSLLLLDFDNFREINQTYGRAAGDAVLVEMARRTERAARNSDIVFRDSGNRFIVFLPNTGITEAATIAERIKRLVQSEACVYRTYEIRLTMSIGVVTVSQDDTRYKLIDRADRALFHAKVLGKDRIHVDAWHECIQEG